MTSTKWMLIALMMVGVLIVTAAQTAPQQQAVLPVGSAVVTEIKGEVTFTSPQGASVNALRGTTLTAESKIETAKGSVLLELKDGSQVLVKGHSSVVLKAPNEGKGFFLEQFLGQIIVKAQKRMGETPSFRMGTPSAVITVRGTRFLVEVNKKHKTYVDVFEGLVEVEGLMPGSPHILLKPGFFSGVDPDRAPEQPRETNPGEGNGKDTGREGQNSGAERSSGDQQKSQPKQSEGKPD
jgi:ferric-dicitrate binding protein FerR (iron transport regulator)